MRNLLPEEYRKVVQQEYWLRIAVVALVLLFIVALIGIVLLVPSYFLSFSKKTSISEQAKLVEQSIALSEQEVSAEELADARERLELLSTDRNGSSIIRLLTTIMMLKPPDVALSDISYEHGGEIQTVTLSGRALRRGDLVTFKEALDRNDSFLHVTLPVSNLAQSADIRFTLSFDVAP